MKKVAGLYAILIIALISAVIALAPSGVEASAEKCAPPAVVDAGLKVQEVSTEIIEIPEEAAEPYVYIEVSGHYFPEVPLDAELQDVLFSCCDEYDIPYAVALGLIQTESGFEPFAVNAESGCYGLCQLNPEYFPSGLCPADNIRHGMRYLAGRIDYYGGDITSGLQAYKNYLDNGGRCYPNTVLTYAAEWERIL